MKLELKQIDFHYWIDLQDEINNLQDDEGFTFIQVIFLGSSGDVEKMHRAQVLFRAPKIEN